MNHFASAALILVTAPLIAQEPKPTNRMAKEQSPYLRQHEHDPVDWYPWGKEAFEKARREDKSVFLSVGYSACHWCHVMQRECFQDASIAKYMNQHFVSVKLDREERPDVDRVYMRACQIMKQAAGGWPLSAFLTADKKPFFVDTYLPPSQFKPLLENIVAAWGDEKRRKGIAEYTTEFADYLAATQRRGATEDLPDLELLEETYQAIIATEDREFGGFSRAPKFPSPSVPLFLLRQAARMGDARTHGASVKRLVDAILAGGIRDHLAGGFHRYSTDRFWKLPHFEKMLYDQALLSQLLAEVYLVWGDERYERALRQTLDWCLSEMRDAGGGFISAYDADADHVEGATYVWKLKELHDLLTKEEAALVVAWCGATEDGNWREESAPTHKTGTNVLYAAEPITKVAAGLGITPKRAEALLASARPKLLKARAGHPQPMADTKVLTGWNGLMISALARSGTALGDPRYVAEAVKIMEHLERHLRQKDGRFRRSMVGDRTRHDGELSDHGAMMTAYLDLHETTLDDRWLQRAKQMAQVLDAHFKHEDGGFVDSTAADLIVQTRDLFDGARPCGSSLAITGLVRLALLTADDGVMSRAHEVLKAVNSELTRSPRAATQTLIALDLVRRPAVRVELHGAGGEGLLQSVRRIYQPFAAVTRKQGAEGPPFVLVCVGKTCLEPARTPEEVAARIEEALR